MSYVALFPDLSFNTFRYHASILLANQITAVAAQKEVHCLGLTRAHFRSLISTYHEEMQDLAQEAKIL